MNSSSAVKRPHPEVSGLEAIGVPRNDENKESAGFEAFSEVSSIGYSEKLGFGGGGELMVQRGDRVPEVVTLREALKWLEVLHHAAMFEVETAEDHRGWVDFLRLVGRSVG